MQENYEDWSKYEELHIVSQIPGPPHALQNRKDEHHGKQKNVNIFLQICGNLTSILMVININHTNIAYICHIYILHFSLQSEL